MKSQKIYYSKRLSQALDVAVKIKKPALFIGETGTGKTSMVYDLARKQGKKVIRVNLTGETGNEDILGKWLLRESAQTGQNQLYWLDGLLIEAMKGGHWIIFDELNVALPEVLSVVNSLLDDDEKIVLKEKEGEEIKASKGFRFFATMNPPENYSGTKELNKALLSRFALVLNVGYSDKEMQILKDRVPGLDDDIAKELVAIANYLRGAKDKGELDYICSTRDLLATAELIEQGLDKEQAIEVSIVNKASQEERKNVINVIKLVTGLDIKIEGKDGNIKKFSNVEDVEEYAEELGRKEQKLEEHKKEIEERNKKIAEQSRQWEEQAEISESLLAWTIWKLEQPGRLRDFRRNIRANSKRVLGTDGVERLEYYQGHGWPLIKSKLK